MIGRRGPGAVHPVITGWSGASRGVGPFTPILYQMGWDKYGGRLKKSKINFSRLPGVGRHHFLHLGEALFNRGDKGELVAATVAVVVRMFDFEIDVAL